MTPSFQEKVDEIFGQAVSLDPEERRAFLSRVCADAPDLHAAAAAQLAHYDRAQADGFLDRPAGAPATTVSDSPSSSAISVPQSIAGYRILGQLGRGGMGIVYKALQPGLNRIVALKMVLHGDYAQPQELLRFRGEAEMIARLSHANIVPIYEVGQHDSRPFFAMEFLEGGSLAEKLKWTPMSNRSAAELVRLLAEALQFAHESGIVHRDLKPGNIMFTPGGVPKVMDFGLAKRLEASSGLTQSGLIMGTPSYMAPEQALGPSHAIGPLCDVYALGAILYECLTGRPPFKADRPWEIVQLVINQEPVALHVLEPTVARDLETICLKCLQKEPGKRYASAAALAEDLNRFLASEPILARPMGKAERLRHWCRRKPALASLIGILVLVLVGGGLVWWRLESGRISRAAALSQRSELDGEGQRVQAHAELAKPVSPAVAKAGEPFRNSIGMEMVPIKAGTFVMGSDLSRDRLPRHEVTIGRNFFIAAHKTTQAQFAKVTGRTPSWFSAAGSNPMVRDLDTAFHPVERITFFDTVEFCNKLSEQEGRMACYKLSDVYRDPGEQGAITKAVVEIVRDGTGYRLPSEAEWEYCARAGTESKYAFGIDEIQLEEYAWYAKNSSGRTHPVGEKKPNPWGLYDMGGLTWDWCQDEVLADHDRASKNGRAGQSGSDANERVARGGSWDLKADMCRPASRTKFGPGVRGGGIGFRVVLVSH
jgi:formylglycine-generating enzyme required for sulfatase activity